MNKSQYDINNSTIYGLWNCRNIENLDQMSEALGN